MVTYTCQDAIALSIDDNRFNELKIYAIYVECKENFPLINLYTT